MRFSILDVYRPDSFDCQQTGTQKRGDNMIVIVNIFPEGLFLELFQTRV
jgi:hypothetical protein